MQNPYDNGLLTVLGVLIQLILVFVLPLLSKDTVYRAATLFGGLNAGILIASIFLDGWARLGRIDLEGLTKATLTTLPKFYMASLIMGAVLIPKYILRASTQSRAILSGIFGAFAYYLLSLAIPNITNFIYYVYVDSPLPPDILLEYFLKVVLRVFYFDSFMTPVMIVSALVAMVATSAIIQKTENIDP